MESKKKSYRRLKICCLVSSLLLIIMVVVLVILFFTIFKPKEPHIANRYVTLEMYKADWPELFLNFTLGIGVTIDNKNYGGFKFENTTAYVSYRGNVIGQAPIAADTISARSKHDLNTSVTIFADKLFRQDGNFTQDFLRGIVNITSASTLHGKVSVLSLFKAKATSLTICDISIFILPQQALSICKSKVSL